MNQNHNWSPEFLQYIFDNNVKFYHYSALVDTERNGEFGDKLTMPGFSKTRIGTIVHKNPLIVQNGNHLDVISCGSITGSYWNSTVEEIVGELRAWNSLGPLSDDD